ncbi:transcription termination/antitermination protein NusA, partial [Streptomyces sp. SID10244]|nr:transcription termination/antitermination protein NusA [Streptomyces sp. SID10244]
MNIDINALRMIEADKGISIDTVITAIETALLTAYRHTEGFAPHARIDVNRKTGAVRVMAQELDDTGEVVHEWDDTP